MAKKEYEIVSHDTLDSLRDELDRLKSTQDFEETKDPTMLAKSMNDLQKSLKHFSDMFEQATQQMKMEEEEQDFLVNTLQPMSKKLEAKMDQILSQNEQIAKGIVAVADMLKTEIPKLKQGMLQIQTQGGDQSYERPTASFERNPLPPIPSPAEGKKKYGLF